MSANTEEQHYYTFTTNAVPLLSQVGGKARALIESKKANFDVPTGFVLSVPFFSRWLNQIQTSQEWLKFVTIITDDAIHDDGIDSDASNFMLKLNEQCEAIKNYGVKNLTLNNHEEEIIQEAFKETFGIVVSDSSRNNSMKKKLFAVRSSSPEEDLEGKSFAGGYETTLGVPLENIRDAIMHSFLSLFDQRVVQYKRQQQLQQGKINAKSAGSFDDNSLSNFDDIRNPRIAVIIQEQIASEVSGVAFTINPQNNCYDEIVINASYGLGETIVSGQVTPDMYVVEKISGNICETKIAANKEIAQFVQSEFLKDEIEEEEKSDIMSIEETKSYVKSVNNDANKASKSSLTNEQIVQVANLAKKVEDHYGIPMDLEWAIQNQNLYLLQARPITTHLPLFDEMLTDPHNDDKYLYVDVVSLSQGFNDFMTPLGVELWNYLVLELNPVFKSKENNRHAPLFTCHGRQYMNLSVFGKVLGKKFIDKQLKERDSMIMDGPTKATLNNIELGQYIPKKSASKKIIRRRISKRIFRAIPDVVACYTNLDESIKKYVEISEKVHHATKEVQQELKNNPSNSSFLQMLNTMSKDLQSLASALLFLFRAIKAKNKLQHLFKDADEADQLLTGIQMNLIGNPTSKMGHMMCQLAAFPEIQETKTGEEFSHKVEKNDYSIEFMALYNEYISRFGCRCIREIEISTSTRPDEDPVSFFNQLKMIDLTNNTINTVKERRQESYDKLLQLAGSKKKQKKFKKLAKVLCSTLGYREDPKCLMVGIINVLRKKALSLGEQWKSENRIDSINDVFSLTMDDIDMAEKDDKLDIRKLVQRNTDPIHAVAHVKWWPTLIDSRGKIYRPPAAAPSGEVVGDGVFNCDPISAGVVQGIANVLNSPYEKPLKQGEILVTRATDPGWTPIFINAAAVVLEVGGSLQHGAIIAREYGIPCVSGFIGATEEIKDGQLIEVDGTNGTVRLVENSTNEKPFIRDENDSQTSVTKHSSSSSSSSSTTGEAENYTSTTTTTTTPAPFVIKAIIVGDEEKKQ